MCYDISFTIDVRTLGDYFPDLVTDTQISMNFDGTHIIGHTYNEHPIIYRHREDNLPHIRMMEWGCIPYYVKELEKFKKQRATMLNARSERILTDTKSYWNKIKSRRCLIPVTGIYEHRAIKGWKNKVPYFVKVAGEHMFFLPGLYSATELVDTETGELTKKWTYTVVTRAANGLMKQIHSEGENKWRMPLFVPFETALHWLEHDLTDEEYKQILDFEMPSDNLEAIPVFSIRTSKLRPDDKAKNERYEWENLPPLELAD
ncbi:DUF159 family protein [Segetibacter sp. 3557_3]|uniref:SOS response-associated peptidase n=1 Tax=Segetibacter sp. 3557_3 TaxID=2547429 RepID=UPI001058CF23|nr:SOS response-associated peptidase family protein [Segetibacter sp. 3557_3]TDH18268.1 DUF159 family protein [Segetibacter sp. 3557_3]